MNNLFTTINLYILENRYYICILLARYKFIIKIHSMFKYILIINFLDNKYNIYKNNYFE